MAITHTGTDDDTATGGGLTYWFSIRGDIYGLCREWPDLGYDGDGKVLADYWVDADDVPMYYPYEQIAPADQRAACRVADGADR